MDRYIPLNWQYNMVFYSLTIPAMLFLSIFVLIGFINPFARVRYLRWVDRMIGAFAIWRWRLIKPMHDKLNLFDILKG